MITALYASASTASPSSATASSFLHSALMASIGALSMRVTSSRLSLTAFFASEIPCRQMRMSSVLMPLAVSASTISSP